VKKNAKGIQRRSVLKGTTALLGLGTASLVAGDASSSRESDSAVMQNTQERRSAVKESIKITRLETFLVKPRWLFLKIHTNAGITGLGEPITEGRALTCAQAVKEVEPYLIGKDPRAVAHHWQAIYRHAFYRGGPILTSALSGIDQVIPNFPSLYEAVVPAPAIAFRTPHPRRRLKLGMHTHPQPVRSAPEPSTG